MSIPDWYADPIETRIRIFTVYLWSGDESLILQIKHDMQFIRRMIPIEFWPRGMLTIQGIDDMLENYGRLISSVVRYLHFSGIAKDEIIRALTWDNTELQRREALAECIAFKESRLMTMLN